MFIVVFVAATLGCSGAPAPQPKPGAGPSAGAAAPSTSGSSAAPASSAPASPNPRTYNLGSYLQCVAAPAAAAECRALGSQCDLLAMVPHPCRNQGALCTDDQLESRDPEGIGPGCVCSCSDTYRAFEASQRGDSDERPRAEPR